MTSSTEFDILSDNEIVSLIREGNQSAMDYLLEKYKYLVRNKAKALFLIGGDRDDLIQEGMIGLYKAVRDFQSDKDNSFFNFADLCISRQIYSAIKASNRKKNIPLNTYISLYAPAYGENSDSEEKETLVDIIHQKNVSNPEELVIDKENTSMIEYELVRRLSNLEKQVLDLYMQDLKYIQIAEVLGKEPKTIDNALTRIKTKLNQVLKDM
ncbi:MAG TPA: RNA polymerase sporulation sigma factor SigH [Lachnospiraceae bacterium]|nr:RNA polymerase sporulation sigma factor SigH [Lachnospiraceae bacterium]HBI74649.1 RNA polymerase sporulation sigma factor SigH [Lachnospiraceae bacterium]HBY71080.1 RNA polymerase sporulation sigma factor SigH [Lachnospiraceae bacterium]HCA69681.1 RNA polymerase sporulation sigma factor SigH [Lachnospiraceae bacterium]HCM12578.1 RNA polymerase sporulation sigma factor SigH [Lachnospiraceae bacterium]